MTAPIPWGRPRITLSRRAPGGLPQFRYPAYVNGHPEPLVEAIAGLLDKRGPEEAIRHEAGEGAGRRVAQYSAADRVATGGGVRAEGEDIEVPEPTLDEALAMAEDGRIVDAENHAAAMGQAAPVAGLRVPPRRPGRA